jgi:hypothetical protein
LVACGQVVRKKFKTHCAYSLTLQAFKAFAAVAQRTRARFQRSYVMPPRPALPGMTWPFFVHSMGSHLT